MAKHDDGFVPVDHLCHRCPKVRPKQRPRRAKHVAPDFYPGEGLCGPCAEEVELEMKAKHGTSQ